MTDTPRKNATKTRGRPFKPGNVGRPKGARNRATLAAEALLDGEAEALTRKAVELALGGDTVALKICLDRILAPRRERFVALSLPNLRSPGDAGEVSAAILDAVTGGLITLGEGNELVGLVAAHVATLESSERYATFPALDLFLRRRSRSEDEG
jgi:hypothetical protein